jgi:HEAT repeat protein
MVLAVIGENGDKKTVMVLQQFYSAAGDLTVKRHALRALVGLGDEELCPWLLSELDRATGAIEKLDLVEALGGLGTADEIEPLRIMFESSRNAKLRSTISSAVEKIRSRVTGAEVGWLTLSYTGEMEGALSRDNGSGGELSSAEEE